MFAASFKRLQSFLPEICVSGGKKGKNLPTISQCCCWGNANLRVSKTWGISPLQSLCYCIYLQVWTQQIWGYTLEMQGYATHTCPASQTNMDRAVPLLSPRLTPMTPDQTWPKQTVSSSPLWLTRISEMHPSSVFWSTDTWASTSPSEVDHTISPFSIHTQILCPFSSPLLCSCEFPKTDIHLSHLILLTSHPTYSCMEQRERLPGKYDNSGVNRGGAWPDLQFVYIGLTPFNLIFLNFYMPVHSQLSLIQSFTCILPFP